MAKCKLIRSSIPAKITGEIMHLAWSNPNPTASFAAQNITLDTDTDYDFVIALMGVTANGEFALSRMALKGKRIAFSYTQTSPNSYVIAYTRDIAYTDATHLSVTDCLVQNSNGARSTNNANMVPMAIYTVKKNLTVDVTAIASSVKTNAQNCMMPDNVTTVVDALATKMPVIKAVESNDPAVMVAWLTAHNADIPVGSSIVDFKYATGVCSKAAVAVGRIRFVSYYSGIDNKSTYTTNGTWSAIS